MAEEREVTFIAAGEGERLDKVISTQPLDLSRATAQRLIKDGAVTVNGRLSKPSYCVQAGDEILVRIPAELPEEVLPEDIPLDVIYEDDVLLVVNKPAGMVVHPAFGHASGTLVNAVLAHCPQVAEAGGPERAGIVHRLDKDTSGLILVAKDEPTRAALQHQFKRRQVVKTYLALVEDQVQPREGIIEAPVGRDKRQRKKDGRGAEGQQGTHDVPGHQVLSSPYVVGGAASHRPHAPDTGASGVAGLPGCGRYGLWPPAPAIAQQPPLSARCAAAFHPSHHRRGGRV